MEGKDHSTEGKKAKKKNPKELKTHERASRFVNPRSFSCRCRLSVIRGVLDRVKPGLSEDRMNSLRLLNVDQFFDIPPYPQHNVLTLQILKCWQYERMAFRMGGKDLRISPDEIALLIGLPNRGEVPKWKKSPSSWVDADQIKNDILNVASGECSTPFDELFLKFILSNIFFPSSNPSVPKELYTFAENVQTFSSFNWPAALCDFLMEQINAVTIKIMRNRSLGYINGFVYLITLWFYEHTNLFTPVHHEARPRMLRWPTDARWNSSKLDLSFKSLTPTQVHDKFLDLKEDERHLLANPDEGLSSSVRAVLPQEAEAKRQSTVQYDVGPFVSSDITQEPAKSGVSQSLEVIIELLRSQDKWFREFQGTLNTINTGVLNIQETMSGRQSSIEKTGQPQVVKDSDLKEKYTQNSSHVDENIGLNDYGTRQPSPAGGVDDLNELVTYELSEEGIHEQFVSSLIERVKGRRSRVKRKLTSPFAGFEYKRRKPREVVVHPSKALLETSAIRAKELPDQTELIVDSSSIVEQPIKSHCDETVATPDVDSPDEVGLEIIISPVAQTIGNEEVPRVREPVATSSVRDDEVQEHFEGIDTAIKDVEQSTTLTLTTLGEKEEIVQSDENAIVPHRTVPNIDYPGRVLISLEMQAVIDECMSLYNERHDIMFRSSGVVMDYGRVLDLLQGGLIANEHVDAFAAQLNKKKDIYPNLFRPYLYVTPLYLMHRRSQAYTFVTHITKTAVEGADIILFPIIHNEHWILLVADLQKSGWKLYDSLSNKMHKSVCYDVIKMFVRDAGKQFRAKLSKWSLSLVSGVPEQNNSIDCGMFVCKFMEKLVQIHHNDWSDEGDWQTDMPKFRAEFAHDLCSLTMSVRRQNSIEHVSPFLFRS